MMEGRDSPSVCAVNRNFYELVTSHRFYGEPQNYSSIVGAHIERIRPPLAGSEVLPSPMVDVPPSPIYGSRAPNYCNSHVLQNEGTRNNRDACRGGFQTRPLYPISVRQMLSEQISDYALS